jgi:hypothetical protein
MSCEQVKEYESHRKTRGEKVKEIYAVENQEVEKAKELYKQKVAVLRAAIAVDSDKDEFATFDHEFEGAEIDLSQDRDEMHLEGDDDHLEDEEEVLNWVLHLRSEAARSARNADASA